jgi:hypothetical protein
MAASVGTLVAGESKRRGYDEVEVEVIGVEVVAFISRSGALQAHGAAARSAGHGMGRESGVSLSQVTVDFIEKEDEKERREAVNYLSTRAKEAAGRAAVLEAEVRQKRSFLAPDELATLQHAFQEAAAERDAYQDAANKFERADLLGRRE